MTIKHKVIKEFQFLSPDKKIFILKVGTILEEYLYKVKNESIPIDKDIIDNNPDFFESLDWKSELLTYIKSQKLAQPAVLSKKLIPFIEDIILSSIKQDTPGIIVDESKIKELERKEVDLNNRDKRISDKEEEIEIRLKRVEKREESHKEELKTLDKKEDLLRDRSKELTEKQLDIEDKLQDIKERERNLDRNLLESSKDIDAKYVELHHKIDKDLKSLSEREKDLEISIKDLKKKEGKILDQEGEVDDKSRNFEIKVEEFKNWESDLIRLNNEIKNWESLHWKLQKMNPPPSAIL
jgi:myosin heavy subunit